MKLDLNDNTVARDLAQALEGNEGTFLAQQGGQTYIAVSRKGHSIISLRPVGQRAMVPSTGQPEPWAIEKISNQEIFDYSEQREQRQTSQARQ